MRMQVNFVAEEEDDAGVVEDLSEGGGLVGGLDNAHGVAELEEVVVGDNFSLFLPELLLERLHVRQPHQPLRLPITHRAALFLASAAAAAAVADGR